MKPLGSIESASEDVFKDARNLFERLRNHTVHEPITVAEAIKSLNHIRQEIYESLNQIQHEYLTIQAAKWLLNDDPTLEGALWLWNPRQTGGSNEPDLVAFRKEISLISAEVTTSLAPVGVIDSRMRDTLTKLNQMKGKKYYFVVSEEMRKRAQTKILKSGWDIKIVLLNDKDAFLK
jgi:hypothetical protein